MAITKNDNLPKIICVTCSLCNSAYPCQCGANEGMPNIDPKDANTKLCFCMSEKQANLYNAANWLKCDRSLLRMLDGSYTLVDGTDWP
jgi:hypothetical protein